VGGGQKKIFGDTQRFIFLCFMMGIIDWLVTKKIFNQALDSPKINIFAVFSFWAVYLKVIGVASK